MTNKNDSEISLFELEKVRNEAEILDLKRFWKDLSWWERDESIASVKYFLAIMKDVDLPSNLEIRRHDILKEINKLDNLNNEDRPSKLTMVVGKFFNVDKEEYKPNLRICLSIISSLSEKTLDDFDRYLGIDKFTKNEGRSPDLYMKVGVNSSMAFFYAFRNYLGRVASK